jgi:hypothetical protein
MTKNVYGWTLTLPLTKAVPMTKNMAVLCGKSMGSGGSYLRQTTEFSFEVTCNDGATNPFSFVGATTYDRITGPAQVQWSASAIARLFSTDPPCSTGTGNRYSLWGDSAATMPYSGGMVYWDTAYSLVDRAYPLMAVKASAGVTSFYIKM